MGGIDGGAEDRAARDDIVMGHIALFCFLPLFLSCLKMSEEFPRPMLDR